MRTLLMHAEKDFDMGSLPGDFVEDLRRDLALDLLFNAMANGDDFVRGVARAAVLGGVGNDVATVRYRQEVLADCFANESIVRALYDLVTETLETRRRDYYGGFLTKYPGSVLWGAVTVLRMLIERLRRLRALAEEHGNRFESPAFLQLFVMLERELTDDYLANVSGHLDELAFPRGVLIAAELGSRGEGKNYSLRLPDDRRPNWLRRLIGASPQALTFRIHPRDTAAARALGELRDRSINQVANALGQSADHVLDFFETLRTELAFYVGCLNLRARLNALGAPLCIPTVDVMGRQTLRCRGLYDVSLALTKRQRVVGNALDANGKSLVIVTGPNTGGKSTFLRALGLAQLMAQCGMFVAAEAFATELCGGLFTHYRREEDASMEHGKLDEELARMSRIADRIGPHALLLCNESFAATNEREGSEIGRQIVLALIANRIKVVFVTHQYELAHGFWRTHREQAVFLRAERKADGTRTFKLPEAEPSATSHGEDLYRSVFGAENTPRVRSPEDQSVGPA